MAGVDQFLEFVLQIDRAAFKQAVLELQKKRSGGRIRGADVLALMKEKYNEEPT